VGCWPSGWAGGLDSTGLVAAEMVVRQGLKSLAITLVLAGVWQSATAAEAERIDCFGLENGLALDSVFDVRIDPAGYPWIGGYRVLGRFDGEQFDVPEPLAEAFSALKGSRAPVAAADGSRWFASSGGVLRWQDQRVAHLSPPAVLDDVPVLAVEADALWLAGGSGLYRRSNTRPEADWGAHVHAGYPLGTDQRLMVNAERVLWLRDQGLIELRRDPHQVDAMLSARVWDARHGLPSQHLASLQEESDQVWWIGSHDGIWRLRADSGRAERIEGTEGWNVRDLHRDARGRWWAATAGLGLQRREADGRWHRFGSAEGLATSTVYRIDESPHGELWLATEGAGLCRVATPALSVIGQEQGLPNEFVHALAVAEQGIWVGGLGGLSRIGTDLRARPTADAELLGRVIVLQPDGDTLWLATDRGLFRRVAERIERMPVELESNISSLALDATGRLWLGGDFGLAWMDAQGLAQRVETPFVDMQDRRVRSVVAARNGGVWVGMDNGQLLHVVQQGREVDVVWQRQVTPEDVRHVHEDADGTLWVLSRGLYRWRGDDSAHFGSREGLTDENLSDWAEDSQGNIWISSYVGLFRLRREVLEHAATGAWLPSVRRFDRRDGLRSAKSLNPGQPSLLVDDGVLWLATSAGVARMALEVAQADASPLRLYWDRLRAGGREQPLQDTVRLPAGVRDVSLEFSVPPAVSQGGLRFRHRILPIQRDWSAPSASRELALPRLPPQNYRIEVQALDGSTEPPTASLSLIVPAHWWESWWGLALILGVLFASLLWLALRIIGWRVAHLQRRSDELKREVATRTLALAKANQDLARLARTDALTGVLNRRGFEEALAVHWQRLEQGQMASCALLLIDIDHFKRYNDFYGHPAGDGALAAVARVLSRQLETGQILARIGGEEFAVLLVQEGDALRDTVAQLRAALARLDLPHHGVAEDARVTLSIGVSQMRSPPDEDAVGWLERADQQLYRAKQAGRDCACFDARCALGDAAQR